MGFLTPATRRDCLVFGLIAGASCIAGAPAPTPQTITLSDDIGQLTPNFLTDVMDAVATLARNPGRMLRFSWDARDKNAGFADLSFRTMDTGGLYPVLQRPDGEVLYLKHNGTNPLHHIHLKIFTSAGALLHEKIQKWSKSLKEMIRKEDPVTLGIKAVAATLAICG